jgi:hypothetical protein
MRIKIPLAVAAVVLGVLMSAPAFAQATLRVDIPGAFTAGGKVVPAGAYEFVEQTPDVILMRPVSAKGPQVELPVITRLASSNDTDSKVVLDKMGTSAMLSEIWIAGQDGYLVYAAKGPHTHQTAKGTKR